MKIYEVRRLCVEDCYEILGYFASEDKATSYIKGLDLHGWQDIPADTAIRKVSYQHRLYIGGEPTDTVTTFIEEFIIIPIEVIE